QVAEPEPRPPVHRPRGDLLPTQLDGAAIGPDETDHHVETGGLACPVGTQQRHDLTACQADVDRVDYLALAVTLTQALGAEHTLASTDPTTRNCHRWPRLHAVGNTFQSRHTRQCYHAPRRDPGEGSRSSDPHSQ